MLDDKKKIDSLLVSWHISLPGIDSYWSCEMVRCKFFCPQVTPSSQWNSSGGRGETGVLTKSHLKNPSQRFSLLTYQFYCPAFLFLYHKLFNISDCSTYPFISSSSLLTKLNPGSLLLLPQAFFNDKYVQEHSEDLEKIEKLKDLIAWQVRLKLKMVICINLRWKLSW